MRCVECGHEIKDGAVFCIRCGAMQTSNKASQGQVAGGTAGGGTAPRPVKQFEPTPKRAGGGTVVFVIAAIAVLAAIVALAMFMLNPGSSSGSASAGSKGGMTISTTSSSASDSSASTSSASSTSSSSKSTSSTSSKSASSASTSAGATASASASSAAGNATGQATGTNNQGGTAQQQQQQAQPQQQQQQQQNVAPAPAPAPAPTEDWGELCNDSNVRVMSKSELQEYSTDSLWIARNEVFARHGRGFRDQYLQNYFNSKSWYSYRYSPDEWDKYHSGDLDSIERANVATMMEIEKERGSSHL